VRAEHDRSEGVQRLVVELDGMDGCKELKEPKGEAKSDMG